MPSQELFPGTFKPTPTHYFMQLLHKKGLLQRCFTQVRRLLGALGVSCRAHQHACWCCWAASGAAVLPSQGSSCWCPAHPTCAPLSFPPLRCKQNIDLLAHHAGLPTHTLEPLNPLLIERSPRCLVAKQNIDSLEHQAGLPKDAVVAAHGNFDSARCIRCGRRHSVEHVRQAVFSSDGNPCYCSHKAREHGLRWAVLYARLGWDESCGRVALVVGCVYKKGRPGAINAYAQLKDKEGRLDRVLVDLLFVCCA